MPSRSTPTTRRTTATTSSAARPRKTSAASPKRTTSSAPAPAPSHDDIARRAHELYVSSGFQGGREVEFWLEAEKQLKDGLQLR